MILAVYFVGSLSVLGVLYRILGVYVGFCVFRTLGGGGGGGGGRLYRVLGSGSW